jgi:hypothetical protein
VHSFVACPAHDMWGSLVLHRPVDASLTCGRKTGTTGPVSHEVVRCAAGLMTGTESAATKQLWLTSGFGTVGPRYSSGL